MLTERSPVDEALVAHGTLEVGLSAVGHQVSIQVLGNKRQDLVTNLDRGDDSAVSAHPK